MSQFKFRRERECYGKGWASIGFCANCGFHISIHSPCQWRCPSLRLYFKRNEQLKRARDKAQ